MIKFRTFCWVVWSVTTVALLVLVNLVALSSSTFAEENSFAGTAWDFSGNRKARATPFSPRRFSQEKRVGILKLDQSEWRAAWYEISKFPIQGLQTGLASSSGPYTVSNDGKQITQFGFLSPEGSFQIITRANGTRTPLSIRWTWTIEDEFEGKKFTYERGILTAKRRPAGIAPAPLAGDWTGNISLGKTKGSANFTVNDFPFHSGPDGDSVDYFFPGFYSISGTIPAPDGTGTLKLLGNFLLNSKNQLAYDQLWTRQNRGTSLSAEGSKGKYEPKSGKLTIYGHVLQRKCTEGECRDKKLPFKIIATRSAM